MNNRMGERESCFQAEVFLIAALVVGILLIVMVPPMGTPDESTHYINAYSISGGRLFPEIVDQQVGRYVPKKYIDFIEKYNVRYTGKLDLKYSYAEEYLDSWLPNEENVEFLYQTKQNAISPVGYTFSAMGMLIGRIYGVFAGELNTLPYNLMLYGRMGNLLFYILAIYFAIRLTPHFKNTMLCLGMMPMSIFMGSSLNYDAVLIPASMLYMACILHVFDRGFISRSEFFAFALSVFFLAGIKQSCIGLLSILFIIPAKCFGGKNRKRVARRVFASIIVIAMIPALICSSLKNQAIDPNRALVDEQTQYLMTHISEFPHIIGNTLKLLMPFYVHSFWGKLGELDVNFPAPVLVVGLFGLLAVTTIDCCTVESFVHNKYNVRILLAIVEFVSIIVFFIAMYLTWTPLPGIADGVGSQYVSGIQGRYFIPLFLPMAFMLSNGLMCKIGISDRLSEVVRRMAFLLCIAYGVMTIWLIFVRFWC